MMSQLDHIVVANSAKIPCTLRTLRPFFSAGESKPWVHLSELSDAVLYLGLKAGLPDAEISALQEQHAKVFSSLKSLSDLEEVPPEGTGNIAEL